MNGAIRTNGNSNAITRGFENLLDKVATRNVQARGPKGKFLVKSERPFFHRIVQWMLPQHSQARHLRQMATFVAQVQHQYGREGANAALEHLNDSSTGRAVPLNKRTVRLATLAAHLQSDGLVHNFPVAHEPVYFNPPVHFYAQPQPMQQTPPSFYPILR